MLAQNFKSADELEITEAQVDTTTFDEVDCKHAADCGWPECDCPRKPKVHSGEAVNYAFNKARELLSAAGFVETAAILDDCRLRPAVADVPLRDVSDAALRHEVQRRGMI